jgi:hypothetical protein
VLIHVDSELAAKDLLNSRMACVFIARGNASLAVPGVEALPSLRLINQCLEQRRLMKTPWFTESEATFAHLHAKGSG